MQIAAFDRFTRMGCSRQIVGAKTTERGRIRRPWEELSMIRVKRLAPAIALFLLPLARGGPPTWVAATPTTQPRDVEIVQLMAEAQTQIRLGNDDGAIWTLRRI